MDMSSREVRMPLDQALAVLRDLNEFVVSLDRLGSRQAAGAADENTIGKFIIDWDVTRRLAHARSVLCVALDAQLSEEENAEIEYLCDQGRFFGTDSASGALPTNLLETASDSGPPNRRRKHLPES